MKDPQGHKTLESSINSKKHILVVFLSTSNKR